MAAMTAVQHHLDFKRTYATTVSKGKQTKVALTAIMRKLVILLNSLVPRSISTTSLPAAT